jgi:nucleotide-binding universal stress UspA family protein
MFERLLFPIDNSRETSHALPLVADIAQRYKSQVYLLSVLDSTELDPEQVEQAAKLSTTCSNTLRLACSRLGSKTSRASIAREKFPSSSATWPTSWRLA